MGHPLSWTTYNVHLCIQIHVSPQQVVTVNDFGDWCYCNWATDCPEIQDVHLCLKALAAVVLAAQRYGHV